MGPGVRSIERTDPTGGVHLMKLISWNVNGLRAILKKGFVDFLEAEEPEIVCLQETK